MNPPEIAMMVVLLVALANLALVVVQAVRRRRAAMTPDMSGDELARWIVTLAFAILTICAAMIVVDWVR